MLKLVLQFVLSCVIFVVVCLAVILVPVVPVQSAPLIKSAPALSHKFFPLIAYFMSTGIVIKKYWYTDLVVWALPLLGLVVSFFLIRAMLRRTDGIKLQTSPVNEWRDSRPEYALRNKSDKT